MFNFFKIFFCLLLTLCIQASSFSDQAISLSDLRSSFSIENNILTTAKGEKYSSYPFKSALHSDLAFILKDLKQAELIHDAYQKFIFPIASKLEEKEEKAFLDALLNVCLLFGNPHHSPLESFLHSLKHQGDSSKKWLADYWREVEIFIEEANAPLYSNLLDKEKKLFTIAILTTSCSGGNLSIARALSEYLSSFPEVEVIQIDTEELAKEIDPMMIATGIYTYEMIYSSILQKTNDLSVIPGRKKLSREIHGYIPSNFLAVLKEKVAHISPDLIISTRSYVIDDLALASLGVPFRMMQTDFELCPSLKSYYREIYDDSVRFWLFNAQPSMFKSMFETYSSLDLYDSQDSYRITMEKMALFLQVPLQKLKEQFEVIGYPVSSSFFHIQDKHVLNRLKKKWGIKDQEIPIFITMGKHGAAASKKIFEELLDAKVDRNLKYIFICGRNEELEKELKLALSNIETTQDLRFAIYGLLSSEEMNEIINICPIGISKAGAASVLETMATRGYLLLMDSYPWEKENGIKLVEMGCASHFNPNKSLIDQIEKTIKISQNRSLCEAKFGLLRGWRFNLKSKIDILIRQKKFLKLSSAKLQPSYAAKSEEEK